MWYNWIPSGKYVRSSIPPQHLQPKRLAENIIGQFFPSTRIHLPHWNSSRALKVVHLADCQPPRYSVMPILVEAVSPDSLHPATRSGEGVLGDDRVSRIFDVYDVFGHMMNFVLTARRKA